MPRVASGRSRGRDAGLLECLLRDVPAVAPKELAELSTTLVLTLLFNPEFGAFASALVRHYGDLVLFTNTPRGRG